MSAAPTLGGGLTPVQWLRMSAAMDCKKRAFARAKEAEAIADWIEDTLAKAAQDAKPGFRGIVPRDAGHAAVLADLARRIDDE